MKTIKLNLVALIFLICAAVTANIANAERKTLVLAADYWCPYNCMPDDKNPGYLIELVKRALYIYGVDIEYRMMPWNVALMKMEDGEIDGLIGISNIRGKELIATGLPLESSVTSTFSRADTEWVYDGLDSLRGKKIGIIMDYAMDESISHYVSINYPKDPGSFIIEDGDLAVIEAINDLIEGRSDVYIEDKRVVKNYIKENGKEEYIRDSGKVDNVDLPIYVAFSKKIPDIKQYVKNLEEGIASLKATGEYEELREKYQMDQ
jgi:polar amino acid transport system substrate-binding protein